MSVKNKNFDPALTGSQGSADTVRDDLQSLKTTIAQGLYDVSPKKIADKMIHQMSAVSRRK